MMENNFYTVFDRNLYRIGDTTYSLLNSQNISPDNIASGPAIDQQNVYVGALVSKKQGFSNVESGYILGIDKGTPKFYIGDDTNYLNWDGTSLTLSGAITATSGTIGGFTIGASTISGTGGTFVAGTLTGVRAELNTGTLKFYNSGNDRIMQLSTNTLTFFEGDGTSNHSIISSDTFGLIIQDDGSSASVPGLYINSITYMMRHLKPEIDDNAIDIGATTSGHRFRTIYLINSPDVSSSREGKENIASLPYGLDTIMKIEPVMYNRKKEKDEDIIQNSLGFIAEDLHKIVPEVASPTSMKPDHLIPILVKGIQELLKRVEELENK